MQANTMMTLFAMNYDIMTLTVNDIMSHPSYTRVFHGTCVLFIATHAKKALVMMMLGQG